MLAWRIVAVVLSSLWTCSSIALPQEFTLDTLAGSAIPATPASATSRSIPNPRAVAVDRSGNVYFSSNHCVFKVDSDGVLHHIAGLDSAGYSGDGGSARDAHLSEPRGLAVDSRGNLFIGPGRTGARHIGALRSCPAFWEAGS